MISKSDYKIDKNILNDALEKEEIFDEKKSINEILNLYWKNRKNFDSPVSERPFLEEVNDEMKIASNSYSSIMDIQKILVGAYNKLTSDAKENKPK